MITASFLIGLFLQISFSGTFALLANVMTGRSDAPWWYPLVFAVYGITIFIVNMFFLKKERTLTGVCLFNGSIAAVVIAGSIIISRAFTFWCITAAIVSVAVLTCFAIMSLIAEPSLRSILFGFEASVLIIIIFAAMVAGEMARPIWILPGAVAMGCAQGALMIKRIGRIPTAREGALIAGVIILMFSVAAVFAIFAAAPAGSGMAYVLGLILSGIKQIGRWIGAFIAWLSSFFKEEAPEAFVPPAPAMTDLEDPSKEIEPMKSLALVAFILLGAIIIVVAVFLLKMFGKTKYNSSAKAFAGAAPIKRDKPSFRQALKKFIDNLKLEAKKRKFLMEYRNTPVGLYYALVMSLSHGKNKKLDGESPREFLNRICLAVSSEDYPDKDKLFDELKDKVDGCLYGPLEYKERFSDPEMIRKIAGAVK